MNTNQSILYASYFSTQTSYGGTPLELFEQSRYLTEATIRRAAITSQEAVILDLGCGCGRLLLPLKHLGYRNLHGVDISDEQVRLASELGLTCVVRDDVLSYLQGTPEGEVDVVFALDVLEHIPKESLIDLVSAVYRALKPGGRFLIHVPNGQAIFSGSIVYGDLTHQTAFTQTSIGQLLRVCGFDQISCFEDRPIIHGPISLFRNLVWRVIRLVFAFIYLVETGSDSILLSQNFMAMATKPTARASCRHPNPGKI
jgi:2-polyprenyl-3-methyl-5-hydroxy-6-metoxy-1,4-benzoquinol methylase